MIKTETFDKIEIASVQELRDWLLAHHGTAESVWLVTYKKHVADKYLSTGQVLDELLCFGWIDGIRRKLDDDRTMQLIAPRKMQAWAQSYKDRVARLEQEGRMHPSGEAAIAQSKLAGLWSVMSDVDALIVPPDLRDALAGRPAAEAYFDACPPSYRRNVLRWIKLAKTPPTRSKRISQTVDSSAAGQRIPQM